MKRQALYRKYRPLDFKSISGQEHIVKTLMNEIVHETINHAYIFAGPKGSGKTSIAKIFSKAINCLSSKNNDPCNECINCVSINNNSSIDFIELDAASNSGVTEIRALIDSTSYVPHDLKYKIYIIDEAHMLTNSSWNALLKTVEAPPENVIFIFATTEYHKIPATIISRSERYDFFKISNRYLINLLTDICKKEKIAIEESALLSIVNMADGSARDALSILDQMCSFTNNDIKESNINDMFGLVNVDLKIDLINDILTTDIKNIILKINDFESKGVNFVHLMSDIIELLMDKYIYSFTKNELLLHKNSAFQIQRIHDSEYLQDIINEYNNALHRIKNSDKPRFDFEFCILSILENKNKNIGKYNTINNDNKEKTLQSVMTDTKKLNLWKNKNSTTPYDGAPIKLEDNIDLNENDDTLDELPPPITPKIFRTQEFSLEDKPTKILKTVSLEDTWNLESTEKHHLSQDKKTSSINNAEPKKTTNVKMENRTSQIVNQINLDKINETNTKDDYKQLFFAIAYNNDGIIKDQHNQILSELSDESPSFSPLINRFLNAKKFLITSKNGAVVLMETQTLVDRFNEVNQDKMFLDFYQQHFGTIQKVFAIDKETARVFVDEYKNLSKQVFDDVKIKREDNDETKTQSLLEILNS